MPVDVQAERSDEIPFAELFPKGEVMIRRALTTTAAAILLVGCTGGGTTTPTPQRVVETFNYTLRLTPSLWPLSGPEFTSQNGVIEVMARVDTSVPIAYGIDLLYLGSDVPHGEGSGGNSTVGNGPVLNGLWNVGFTGRFQTRIYPASRAPLPVPATGVNVPVTFTVTHP
jgi:hypothetical protein